MSCHLPPMPALALIMPVRAFLQSDIVGQVVSLLLLGLSFYTVFVIASKWKSLGGFKSYNIEFLKNYEKHPHPAYLFLDPRGLLSGSPIGAVYMEGIKALLSHLHSHGVTDGNLRAWKPGETCPVLDDAEVDAIRGVCERAAAQQQLVLESQMSRISTAIATAPSLGLFGTVWGVMGAFMSMTAGGSSMISNVAPGIAGALLTTVAGLAVAIPSTIFYNILAGIIRRHVVALENFEDSFIGDIIRIHALPPGTSAPVPVAAPADSPSDDTAGDPA